MPKVLIVADDLTGALDSAVAFAGGGRKVLVARTPLAIPAAFSSDPDVLAVNTASREGTEKVARERVTEVMGHPELKSAQLIMKKVDSRLKGHVGAEVEALSENCGAARIVVAPAIPAMGRRVRDGILFGEGIDVDKWIAPLFRRDVDIPDTIEESDMGDVVEGLPENTLWVGARSLAAALAQACYGASKAGVQTLPKPCVIINGSRDRQTVAQVDALRAAAEVIDAPDGKFSAPSRQVDLEAVTITDGGTGLTGDAAGKTFTASIAHFLRNTRPRTIVIAGGETSNAVLGQLEIDVLTVHSEFRPGMPLCQCNAPWGPIWLVSKSGGFGSVDVLRDIALELTDAADSTLSKDIK